MSTTRLLPPLNLQAWINDNRHALKPPVGNKCVWEDRDFIVMVVGGPNHRKDFHVNPTEELFLQIEGDMIVRIIDHHGVQRDIPIRQGELFLLPPNVPHSPQRPANTVGLVVERRRPQGEDDHLRFYCDKCGATVYEEQFELRDIAQQLKRLMEHFWSDATLRTCVHCGTVVQPPTGPALPPPPDMKPDLPPVDSPVVSKSKLAGKAPMKSQSPLRSQLKTPARRGVTAHVSPTRTPTSRPAALTARAKAQPARKSRG